jgi:hypothetical protein
MSTGLALVLIFCTPLGWIGIFLVGLMVAHVISEARS